MSSKGFSTTVRKHLSEELKKLRQENNLSIPEIALKSDLSIENIEDIEQGKMVSFARYKSLAFFYGKKIKFGLE